MADGQGGSRTVVVTGASSGIGVAIAKAFAERGDRVAIGARRMDRLHEVREEIEKSGGSVFSHELDVTSLASIRAFLAATREGLGQIDIVINNAGISLPNWIHELETEELEREVATNLTAPMLISREVLGEMRERRAGDLVFIGSDNADNPRPQQAGYSATKAAIKNFCRTLALELEGTGVRVIHMRLGPAASEFGAGWGEAKLEAVVDNWVRYGLMRNPAMIDGASVAQAIVHAVDAPRTATWANIELQPTAPIDEGAT